MIKFEDFIKVPCPERTKVKFNMKTGDSSITAWDLLLEDDPLWTTLNGWRSTHPNHNLNHADYLIALAQYYPYGPEYFVFGGIYKVDRIVPEILDGIGYKLFLLDDFQEYIKRLIIKIDKPIGRNLYNRKYESLQEQLNPEIYELAPGSKLGHFPGYQNVSLNHKDMQLIVKSEEPSWQQALSNVKGIYVVTDTSNGKLYIGSASGNSDGIWQRWSGYADPKNLTGGNKEFINILKDKGDNYIADNFKYSILEIFDTKTKVETIIDRENYWKGVFESKKYGMNHN
ncbi:hypothetical protein DSECCO2_49500 [anaerobic digester metagenome]